MQIPPFTLDRQFQEIGSEIESEVSKVLKGDSILEDKKLPNLRKVFQL